MKSISDSSVKQSELKEQDLSWQELKSFPKAIAKTPKQRFRWTIPILITLIIAGGSIYFVSRRQNVQPKLESLTVPVKTQSLNLRLEASGSIKPVNCVNISPKNAGRLAALYIEQGDRVKAGQLLAKMDSANLIAELAQAQAELAQAQAEYTKVLNGNRQEAIARAKSQVLSAQAQVDLSTKKLEKNRFLAKEGAIAQLTCDQCLSTDKTARASLAQAQEQLRELEKGSRPEEIEQFKAKVAAAKAKVALVQTQIKDTGIYAPFDGIVSQKYATVGAIVTPNVSASTTSSATSTSIVSIASRLEVKVELITGEAELRSGMNVDAVFVGKKIDNALTIPTVAITTKQGEIGVMVAGDRGKAEFKPVRVGFSEGGQTQIVRGLEPGDLVFIDFPPK
jgi:HlyD family secretion protein